jgi:hypothetical protein
MLYIPVFNIAALSSTSFFIYAVNNVFHIGSNVSVFLFFVWLFPPGKVNLMLLLYYFYRYILIMQESLNVFAHYCAIPVDKYDINSKISFLDSTLYCFGKEKAKCEVSKFSFRF